MDVVEFRERVYLKYEDKLFTYEDAWDALRPIDGVAWNGNVFLPLDNSYKLDLMSPYYGYGTREIKLLCSKLLTTFNVDTCRDIDDPILFWRWTGQTNAEWWRDRPCIFTSKCVSRSPDSWRKYIGFLHVKPRTVRQSVLKRITRKKSLRMN